MPDTGPDHESADEINGVRCSQLGFQLRADVGLTFSVDEQITLAERRRRQRRQRLSVSERRLPLDAAENPRRKRKLGGIQTFAVSDQIPEQAIDTTDVHLGRFIRFQLTLDLTHCVARQAVGPLSRIERPFLPELLADSVELIT